MTKLLTVQRVGASLLMAIALTVVGLVVAPSAGAQETFDVIEVGKSAGFGTQTTLSQTIGSIIKVALSLLGVIALILVLVGGFMWMTAAGNEDKVKKAKDLLIAGVVGLLIILAGYALTIFVVGALQSATGSNPVKVQ